MRISIEHEFDAPLDAVELALLSPDLATRVGRALTSIETVVQVRHELVGDVLEREWRFVAAVPLPPFARGAMAREVLAWRELRSYARGTRAARWTVEAELKPEWRRYFRSEGTWRLDRVPDGRTRRTIDGSLDIKVAVVGPFAERLILNEVKKTLDAEAEAIRDMATVR